MGFFSILMIRCVGPERESKEKQWYRSTQYIHVAKLAEATNRQTQKRRHRAMPPLCHTCCLSHRCEHGFRQGGNHFKQVPPHAIVGDLEDGCVLVLVDGDHRLRALHSHEMLNRPRDADRKIELRRYRLARAPYLSLHG